LGDGKRAHRVYLISADPLRGGPPRQYLASRQEQFLRQAGQHHLRTRRLAISWPICTRTRSFGAISRVHALGASRVIERS
jgi:hypothetical protein